MRLAAQAAVVAALAGGIAFADDWTKTYVVSGQPEIRVETDDGNVTVRTWNENRIAVRVTTAGWKIGPGEVEVRESLSGNRLELTVRSSHRHWSFFSVGMHSIEVDLHVPRQVQSDIRTGDGNIDVLSLQGQTRLRTGDGHIEADSLDGSLEATTGDGHMRVRGRLDVVTLHSGDGRIDAEVLPGSKMASSWRVESGDGGVTVRLPRDFGADLDVHTGDGSISVDFPLTTTAGGRRDHDLRARINAGGAPFYIRTGDGSIRIGRL
ncbi:MAG: DUF4097 family beta strand repeat-containing protein [Bryobacteraceae bacterium]|jgi:hypothetical protein